MSQFNQTFTLESGAKVQIVDRDAGAPQQFTRKFVALLVEGAWPEDMAPVAKLAQDMGGITHHFGMHCDPVGANAHKIEFLMD